MTRMGGGPRRWLCAGALLCALGALWPAPLRAGQWQALDWPLPGRIRQVLMITWQEQPAVMVTAPASAGGASAVLLQVLRVAGGAVAVSAQWNLPADVRWVEPIALETGHQSWLALRADGWYLAQGEGEALTWRKACTCASVFAEGDDPDPLGTRLAQDMNGDGVAQLLLPDPEGMTVYRWVPDPGVMEPWWRYRWDDPLLRDPKHSTAWELPRYWVLDTHHSGLRDIVLHHADHLTVYPYPGAITPHYTLNGAARVRLESVTLPAALRRALVALGNVKYPDLARLLAALPLPADPRQRTDWLAALPGALWALRADPTVVPPQPMALPGAPKLHAGDYAFPLALEDLTGNGYVDLLQATVRTDSSDLGLRGELRLYQGNEVEGQWAFPSPGKPISTGGAAVAELFRIGTAADAPAALAVASTDVTLGAILNTLSSGKVKLDLDLHVLHAGQFNNKPDQHTRMIMEGVTSGARPLVLAADLDGDGWRELLITRRPDLMLVFPGSPNGPRIGAPALADLKGPVPRKPQEAFVADLDGSGRESLVFWYHSGHFSDALRQTLRFVTWKD